MASGARVTSHRASAHPRGRSADPASDGSQAVHDEGDADGDGAEVDGPPVETRRERQRRETMEEIKAAARQQLTLESTSALSLRAVARDVGLTPSAIYRYFESQQDLVAAVTNDAFTSATASLLAALEAAEDRHAGEQLRTLGYAYRGWAQQHKAEFNLMFNTDLADLMAPGAVDPVTLERFFAVPLAIYTDGIRAEQIDVAPRPASDLSPRVQRFADQVEVEVSSADLGVLISGWASFHGFVTLELFGQLDQFFADPDAAFDRHLRAVITGVGARPPG